MYYEVAWRSLQMFRLTKKLYVSRYYAMLRFSLCVCCAALRISVPAGSIYGFGWPGSMSNGSYGGRNHLLLEQKVRDPAVASPNTCSTPASSSSSARPCAPSAPWPSVSRRHKQEQHCHYYCYWNCIHTCQGRPLKPYKYIIVAPISNWTGES